MNVKLSLLSTSDSRKNSEKVNVKLIADFVNEEHLFYELTLSKAELLKLLERLVLCKLS